MSGWLLLAGAVALWLLLRRRRRPVADQGPYLVEYEDARGRSHVVSCPTWAWAEAAVMQTGGRLLPKGSAER